MIKRQMFYSNGEMIDYRLPNSFVKSTTNKLVGIVPCILIVEVFVEFLKLMELKITMFATDGDSDISSDEVN